MKRANLTVTDVYRLCNENEWFTSGSNEQYNKMFSMVDGECPIHDISIAIWICTEGSDLGFIEHCLQDIEDSRAIDNIFEDGF